jgi:hypothetical protein
MALVRHVEALLPNKKAPHVIHAELFVCQRMNDFLEDEIQKSRFKLIAVR